MTNHSPDRDHLALNATREWLSLTALTADGRGEDVTEALASMEPDELLGVLLWGLNGTCDLLQVCANIPRQEIGPLLRSLASDVDNLGGAL